MFSLYQNRIVILLLLLRCLPAVGQTTSFRLAPPTYELEHLKLNNKEDIGLFNEITEDKSGFLWLTGRKGLLVFDGNQALLYRNGNAQFPLEPDSGTTNLYRLGKNADGNLWMLQETKRFIFFDPLKRKYLNSISSKNKDDLFLFGQSGRNGTFFISGFNRTTGRASIWKKNADGSLSDIYSTSTNLQKGYFYELTVNYHWLICSDKIVRISIDGKNTLEYKLPPGTLVSPKIYNDGNRVFLISDSEDAIYYLDEQTNKTEKLINLPALVKNKVGGFVIRENKIYLSSNLNFFIIDRSDNSMQDLSPGFIDLAKKESPNSFGTGFLKLFFCSDSSLLVCSQANIYRLKKKVPEEEKFRQKINVRNNPLPLLSIRGLAEDEHNNIFVSYYTGIAKKAVHENKFTEIDTKKYINSDVVSTYSLNYWKGNLLWNNVKIDLATGKYNYLGSEKFGGHCTQYLHNDTLWFIIWRTNELNCYDLKNAVLSSYPLDKKMTAGRGVLDAVCSITGDASGKNLWVSSNYEGISLLSKKAVLLKQYSAKDLATTDVDVNELEPIGNELWYGCADGLGVLNTITGKAIVYKNPAITNSGVLQNRIVFSILPDGNGNLYLGSNFGLLWFNTQRREFYTLADNHPLSKIEFNRTADFIASDGRYYFGTTNGLYAFNKNELDFSRSSDSIRKIQLNGVSIFNSNANAYRYLSADLNGDGKLILYAFDRNIEFNFSVAEFYKKVYYSYRVAGQGNKWTDYNPDNKILLYGLQPGSYTLEVKASTGLTDENASYYSLPIEVRQIWYKTIWVITLFSLAAAFAVTSLLRYRFNQKLKGQKALAALRTKISSDLHDDVGTLLSGLAMQSQMLSYRVKKEEKEQLNEISDMGREAMEKMRDIVWAMDNRKDKFENLIDRMRAFAEKNLSIKNITHEFIVNHIDAKKFIDPEKRQAVYLIFKEAIINIIKHADAGHVVINFTQDKNKLFLRIHDNGSEKSTLHSDGLGLSNMIMRAKKIGGVVSTRYEGGFVVELNISS